MTTEQLDQNGDDRARLLAQRLGRARAAQTRGARQAPSRPGPQPRSERPALSFAQQRLWFLDRLIPGNLAYTMQDTAYRLKGELDPVALERAWQAVEERHEVLRSRFGNDGDQPHVIVDPAGTIPLERLDLSGAADPEQAARDHTQTQADQPFDLATGPLTRAHLLHLAPQDHILLITVHHSIFDGWSINVLENDLTHAYHAALANQPPTWPQLPLHYTDFASWQRQTLTGPTL
ncbi:condensation domain-containing protein, partial [Kitasatospora sp. NPDC093806]|uniref:condensation domain-containing protein n=1 Tax=Kitasatospora sp. NPDC093806 TaxID=3155075 RepID=UPI00342085CE